MNKIPSPDADIQYVSRVVWSLFMERKDKHEPRVEDEIRKIKDLHRAKVTR